MSVECWFPKNRWRRRYMLVECSSPITPLPALRAKRGDGVGEKLLRASAALE
jgi:hypothetical protein